MSNILCYQRNQHCHCALIVNTDTAINIYSLRPPPPHHHHYLSLSTKSKVILIFKITLFWWFDLDLQDHQKVVILPISDCTLETSCNNAAYHITITYQWSSRYTGCYWNGRFGFDSRPGQSKIGIYSFLSWRSALKDIAWNLHRVWNRQE